MDMKQLKTLERVVTMYKEYEHGKLQSVSGAEIDRLLKDSEAYDKKLKELRKKLEARMLEHTAEATHKEVFALLTQILGAGSPEHLVKQFNLKLVKQGKIKPRFVQILKEVAQLKDRVKVKKMNQNTMDMLRREASELTNALVDYSQRKELVLLERGLLRIKIGSELAELVVTDKGVFVAQPGKIRAVRHDKLVVVDAQELDAALRETKDKTKLAVDAKTLTLLRKELGDFELLL